MGERIDYGDLDPRRQDEDEKARNRAKRRAGALDMQRETDLVNLIANPAFIRWFFTTLDKAGIYQAAFLPHEGATQYAAGRRGLGVELLSDALRLDPQFSIRIAMEQAKLEETLNARDTDPT